MTFELKPNAPIRDEYEKVLKALESVLDNLPPVIIAIDGKMGTGKTTLGRYLAWYFNVTLIETDLFIDRRNCLSQENPEISYRTDELKRVVDHRIEHERPIIFEGVVALELLSEMEFGYDFHVRYESERDDGTPLTDKIWEEYVANYVLNPAKSIEIKCPADEN